jgi:hypothetical protein
MKLFGILALAFALLSGETGVADEGGAPGEALATQRRVHGVVTSVEATSLTIATSQKAISGRIDPARTRVTVKGRPAKASELALTAHAKAELCLDDVWLSIDIH